MNLKTVYEPYKKTRIQDACKATFKALLQKLTDSRKSIIDSQALDLNNFIEDYALTDEQVVREADQQLPNDKVRDILKGEGFEGFDNFTELGEEADNWNQIVQILNVALSNTEMEDLMEGIILVFDLDYDGE